MNGFMQWFKSSSKMKRWMFLILIGNNFSMLWNSRDISTKRNVIQ